MESVRIVIVGAGSRSFGPSSVRDVLLSDMLAERDVTLALVDRKPDALDEVAAYARRSAERLGRFTHIEASTDVERVLEGAAFVISAIEVQRFLYWSQDFHIPRKHGFRQVFGENGGPGSLFHALRNIPPTLAIARAMERLCPQAYLLNFTNPEHKLCEAVSRLTRIRPVGLCHGVFSGIRQMAHLLQMPVERLDCAACGINHFTFFEYVRDRETGEDLYPRLREAEREGDWLSDWHELALARVLFRRYGLWPSPGPNHYGEYIGWAEEFVVSEAQYFYDPADGHPWDTGHIPEFVYTLSGRVTDRPFVPETVAQTPLDESPLRPSGEVAVPLIEAIVTGCRRTIEAVNMPNRGCIPNLPEDMIVEAPADAGAEGLRLCPMAPLPEAIAAMLRVQGSIHKLLVEAYAEESRDRLLQAFLLDPTVNSYRRAVECVDEMLQLQAAILPPFR